MAFKDTSKSDYVVGQVWMRRGADAFLLDQVHDRMDFVTTCQQFRELAAKWPQATLKLVEDKANGTAVINALRRIVIGIVPEEPHGSKEARAAAVSPLVEAGNVHLPTPELAPWVGDLIEEAAAFPNGAHDDQVDAMSQALNRLILAPLLAGEDLEEPDEFDELDTVGHAISPY
jgi:predicted phage terminase large subunit-like protein